MRELQNFWAVVEDSKTWLNEKCALCGYEPPASGWTYDQAKLGHQQKCWAEHSAPWARHYTLERLRS